MSEFNVYELSKLPKEILIKILLAKDNTQYFDLSYCYAMRDRITNKIDSLKNKIIKDKLIELIENEKIFIADMTGIRTSKNTYLKFEYLNHIITMGQDVIDVLLNGIIIYKERDGEVRKNQITFTKSLKNFQNLLFSYTLFESICWFLDNDKLTLDI
jgi:hypothetical protein